MKKILIGVFIVLFVYGLHVCVKKEEARRLVAIKTFLKSDDARVVWSEGMSDGEIRNFTYWKNDHCLAVIGMKGGKTYFVNGSHCSEHKLTKD